jgi:hypothetical protein
MASKSSVRDEESTESKFNSEPVSRVVPKIKGRERKEVQLLLERGRMKGHLTYDELNDALPPDMVTSDQIDDLMVWLQSEDIDVSMARPTARAERVRFPLLQRGARPDGPPRFRLPPMIATRRSRTTRFACTCERWGRFHS